MNNPPTILCLASYFKGNRFLRAAHDKGCRVLLLTSKRLSDEPWDMDAIHERYLMPDLQDAQAMINAVSYLSRSIKIHRIVALDEYDTHMAAALREHMRLPGMGATTARYFRDKLAMRAKAREAGLDVPGFSGLFYQGDIEAFLHESGAPWLIKPRTEASAMGIRRADSADEALDIIDELGDARSYHLIESFVPGTIVHVDSVIENGDVVFQYASRYGRPPLEVYQGGGVFVTRTIHPESERAARLFEQNEKVVREFGMVRGVTHAEFIESRDGDRVVFLEVAARVGGANIDLLIEAASSVNLWEEWARLEVDRLHGRTYEPRTIRGDHSALLVCLAKDEWPDTSSFDDDSVWWRLKKKHHAGLIMAGTDGDHIDDVLSRYTAEFAERFLAVAPPKSSAAEED